jgi:hypothetical protein
VSTFRPIRFSSANTRCSSIRTNKATMASASLSMVFYLLLIDTFICEFSLIMLFWLHNLFASFDACVGGVLMASRQKLRRFFILFFLVFN